MKVVEVYGDSILKGIQVNPLNMRYYVDNNIDVKGIESTYSLSIMNFSRFGCTIDKGFEVIEKRVRKNKELCDAIVMDFGGNDCDFDWKKVAEDPNKKHLPNIPLEIFVEIYYKILELLKGIGVRPIITTLPPLDAQRFFNWYCETLNKENVLKFLGEVSSIFTWQENYSKTIQQIAKETDTLLIDIRSAFVNTDNIGNYLCIDGIHPNTEGQKLLTQTFLDFIDSSKSLGYIRI